MLAKYFTCNTKQKTDLEPSQDNKSAGEESRGTRKELEQEKNQGHDKWKLTEFIVCYTDEYATGTTDVLNKTISQEVPWSLLINRCTLG